MAFRSARRVHARRHARLAAHRARNLDGARVELQSRFLSAVATSALASRRELGDKVRLLELRHSAENLPNQNSCRRVVEDASGLSTAISSTPSPCKNPKPVSCTMRSRAKREASCGRRCLRSPSASRRTLALSDRIRPHLQVGVSGTMSKQQCSTIPKRDLLKL